MFAGSVRRFAVVVALALPLSFALTGCGGGKDEVKHAEVKAGTMPDGGEWQGVYYNQHYGELHIVADGNAANGAWKTPNGEFGELHGTIEGNLLKYEWKERRIGAVGKDATRSGKGYFLYVEPKAGEAHEIQGEWGEGESDAGNKWDGVKQKNKQPDLASQQPDEYEGQVTGGGWDDEKKQEAPAGEKKDELTAPE